jgi:hypothetical protein
MQANFCPNEPDVHHGQHLVLHGRHPMKTELCSGWYQAKQHRHLSHRISLPTLASVTISTLALILWPYHAPWAMMHHYFTVRMRTSHPCPLPTLALIYHLENLKVLHLLAGVTQQVSLAVPWRHSLPDTAWSSCCCVTFLSACGPSCLTFLPLANTGVQSLPRAVAAASLFCLQVPVPVSLSCPLPTLALSHCLGQLQLRRFSVCKWPVPSHYPAPCQHWLSVTDLDSCSCLSEHPWLTTADVSHTQGEGGGGHSFLL